MTDNTLNRIKISLNCVSTKRLGCHWSFEKKLGRNQARRKQH
jgi:hypothetical protein